MNRNILITGGAGFIGSHVVRLFAKRYPHYQIYNLDKLTYAGNLENLRDVEPAENYHFVKGDITDQAFINDLFDTHRFAGVIHLAAESHVDRSITNPLEFVMTNVVGTAILLNAFRRYCDQDQARFYHVSTDEVYGDLQMSDPAFTESTPYKPSSPYSASKAGSDHLVRAYHHTYGTPVVISNCSNNYGSHQFPEKLIPLMIHNIRNRKPLPVYGKGENVRDWLWVEDHARAIDLIYHRGTLGETYNIGGNNEWKNIDLVHKLCEIMDRKLERNAGESASLITYVTDRAGHDFRYAINAEKLSTELGWSPSVNFDEGFDKTIDWYLHNEEWLDHVTSGAYLHYYEAMYDNR
jgi:dTDP-glucose 4,6-dehydratase